MALQLDREDFLARYWQREPLLLRNALPGFTPPLDAGELAGLAMEDEVESRIIEEAGGGWLLSHGPFGETEFHRDTPWTLLVQAVDHYVPEVAELRQLVDFIPQWRIDDVMVSYAVDGGSVGPHYDNYDVFLLQGEGRRRWRVGQQCDATTALLPHDELRILRDFQCRAEYVLGPGDILYLPPGVAHWGIAEGECTTFSIGFRAPRVSDLLSRMVDARLEGLDPQWLFTDPGRNAVSRPGEISAMDLERARALALQALSAECDGRWLGELVTEAGEKTCLPEPEEAPAWSEAGAAFLDDAARVAWLEQDCAVLVFANGQSREFDGALAPAIAALCAQRQWQRAEIETLRTSAQGEALLDFLVQAACLYSD
ncbi:cupin domain-containing protein [Mangrovimicrobium sediminis]|uniref:Cupin domain-containing protein n=1 Tax=Mangrovimicrobium sediminis TaxID=2562682 RepID=A0A4Z0M6R4_9GAMM|nr:cupin domain-containing protein [Haliea sp. SAOS-164]